MLTRRIRPEDRRRFGRIHFETPIPARVGETRVRLLDLGLNGVHVASESRFAPASSVDLKFDTDVGSVNVRCRVIRCTLSEYSNKPGQKSVYETGLRILETIGESDHIIRETIALHVARALEEQKANAYGIPPLESLLSQEVPAIERYRKCEYIDGRWQFSETAASAQPVSGFTIAAHVPLHHVDMLCKTYQRADEEGRRLTKIFAQLSVTKGEGVPTRKYLP
jgi:hypothetical protein